MCNGMRYDLGMSNIASLPQPASNGNTLVAANIRAELAYAGTSQTALAHTLGLSDMALSRRLSDRYAAEFSATEIMVAANFFGVDPGALFTNRRRPQRPDPVGPAGIEPTTSTVECERLAPVTPLFRDVEVTQAV